MSQQNSSRPGIDSHALRSAYRQGYGDCKAHLLKMVQEALKSLHEACQKNKVIVPTEENIRTLRAREAELRRLRTMVKSLGNKGK